MAKIAIFIIDDNEKITHMFTAEHGFNAGIVTPDREKVEFTTKQGVLSLFNVVDECQPNVLEVETCINKMMVQPTEMGYKGKMAYYYEDVPGFEPVKYVLAPPNDYGYNIFKRGDNTAIAIRIQPETPQQTSLAPAQNVDIHSNQDGSSVNSISAPVQPESISTQVPVAIPIDEPHEIQTVLATALQIAEPINNI